MAEKDEIQNIVHSIAGELIQVVNKEHSMLLSEIARMKTIINEASRGLQESFNGLSNDNKELLHKINSAIESSEEPVKINEEISRLQINKNMNTGIRALQFEDIVQQMLDHVRHRIYSIERLFSILEKKVNHLNDGAVNEEKIKEMLLDCHTEIQKTRKLLELENPVLQDSLSKNDVTLF